MVQEGENSETMTGHVEELKKKVVHFKVMFSFFKTL